MNALKCPKILAHRGLSHLAPENTMVAFKKAMDLGFNWLEFDVMLSKDNHPIIFHDETLNRTTNAKGLLSHKTLHQLQALDAGGWFSKAYQGEAIPSLETVLSFMKKNHLNAVVEIKPTSNKDILTAEKTIQAIEKFWPEGLKHMIFASFSLASLITLRKHLPKQALGFGLHNWNEEVIELIKSLDCFSIHVNHLILSAKRMKLLKSSNCHILAYTVNNPKRAAKLLKIGVDGFFSDCPEKLHQ